MFRMTASIAVSVFALVAMVSSGEPARDKDAVWELWLPPNGTPVRAIVVCPRWGDGATMAGLVQRELGARLGVGTMLSYRDSEMLAELRDPAFVETMARCLKTSAATLKRPELTHVPLILWAHSNAAAYIQHSLKSIPERIVAYCLFKSAFASNNDLGTMSPAAVDAFGQSIWDLNDRIGHGYDADKERREMMFNIGAARTQGALIHATLVRGTHHVIDGQGKLMLAFFETAIRQRIPPDADPAKGPVKLIGGLEKSGWCQDIPAKSIHPYEGYPADKDPRRGWWLPSREYAVLWNAYALNAKGTVAE